MTIKGLWSITREHLDFTMKLGTNDAKLYCVYRNLGITYNSLGDDQRAVEYDERAIRLNQGTGNKQGEAAAFDNLATAYNSLGDT